MDPYKTFVNREVSDVKREGLDKSGVQEMMRG